MIWLDRRSGGCNRGMKMERKTNKRRLFMMFLSHRSGVLKKIAILCGIIDLPLSLEVFERRNSSKKTLRYREKYLEFKGLRA